MLPGMKRFEEVLFVTDRVFINFAITVYFRYTCVLISLLRELSHRIQDLRYLHVIHVDYAI